MNENIVAYDKSARNWIYTNPNGSTFSFPRGVAGKTEAYMMRLKTETPKVAKMLQHLETTDIDSNIMKRAFDGAVILANDYLLMPSDDDDPAVKARAATKSAPKEYLICPNEIPDNLYFCSCPDWMRGYDTTDGFVGPELNPSFEDMPSGAPKLPGIGFMCKHTWAYHLGSLISYPLSRENPNYREMGIKLWDAVQKILVDSPDLYELFKDCKPMQMSRGDFSLVVSQPVINKMKKTPSLRKHLEDAVRDVSGGSQVLIIF